MQAGPTHTVSGLGGWVTSETAARQKFIGNQYFVPPSSTSVQGLSDMGKIQQGRPDSLFFVSFSNDDTLEIIVPCNPEQIPVDHDVTYPQEVSLHCGGVTNFLKISGTSSS